MAVVVRKYDIASWDGLVWIALAYRGGDGGAGIGDGIYVDAQKAPFGKRKENSYKTCCRKRSWDPSLGSGARDGVSACGF